MPTPFGIALKSARTDLGFSQLELAHALGSTQRHISFLETGRSRPSLSFVLRLSTDLGLSLPQRAALFDAAGFDNPYRRRDFGAEEMAELLDMIQRRVLQHWPFAGFVMDKEWNILRANPAGHLLLETFLGPGALSANEPPSFYALMLAPEFRGQIENWEEASLIYYYRMQAVAAESPRLAALLEQAWADGSFAHVPERLASGSDVPPFVPVVLRLPNGTRLQLSSLVGHLASVHDAAIDGLEIELLIPMDDTAETILSMQPG